MIISFLKREERIKQILKKSKSWLNKNQITGGKFKTNYINNTLNKIE